MTTPVIIRISGQMERECNLYHPIERLFRRSILSLFLRLAASTGPYPRQTRRTMSTCHGAIDLDAMLAEMGPQKLPERLYCAKGTKVSLELSATLPANAALSAAVSTANGAVIAEHRIGAEPSHSTGEVPATGWQTVSLKGSGLPDAGIEFHLAVTYTGAPS